MHETVKKLLQIEKIVKSKRNEFNIKELPKIIAVTKTFKKDIFQSLIDYGHKDFGENKVQEALEKWTIIKDKRPEIKLHLIGKLQTNKVKLAIRIFDYIHSLDSKKLAKKISDEQIKQDKKIKIFIQVNIGDEYQKSGINKNDLNELISYCKDINLNVIGLMCIPPLNDDPIKYFKEMNELNKNYSFDELSMGMSSDYLKAIECQATFVRIGSNIFGLRS